MLNKHQKEVLTEKWSCVEGKRDHLLMWGAQDHHTLCCLNLQHETTFKQTHTLKLAEIMLKVCKDLDLSGFKFDGKKCQNEHIWGARPSVGHAVGPCFCCS